MQLQLKHLLLENEELQRKLNCASNYIDDTLKKHNGLICQYKNDYNELWKKYQNKSIELNKNKSNKEFFIGKIEELNSKCESLECHLKEQYDKNQCLQEQNSKLEKFLNDNKQNITLLKGQLQNQKQCFNKNCEESNRTTHEMNGKIDSRNQEKEEHCKLKSKIQCLENELSKNIEKSKSEINQLTKNIDCLKIEIELQKKKNTELNQMLSEQNDKQQELTEMLVQSNKSNKVLKETMGKEKAQTNNYICKLRKEKLDIEKKKDELEKKGEKRIEELKKMEHKNEQLKSRNSELQCKLDIAIKNSGGYLKTSTEKIEKMYDDNKKLKNDLTFKNHRITELENKLLDVKNIHTGKADNVQNLKEQLDNIQCRQNNITPINKCHQNSTNDDNFQLPNTVLDDLKIDCEHLTTSIKFDDCGINHLEERNQLFEKLITKCISILNYF